VIHVAARQFGFALSESPITNNEEWARRAGSPPELPSGALIEFRVTSLDVNHGFGLYGPDGRLVAQTQAMPGYVNRLRVRLDRPRAYLILCLEYCGLAHHAMRAEVTVR
jgi:cytochrome c oxidase subunit 2